jgi:hypothetical protein
VFAMSWRPTLGKEIFGQKRAHGTNDRKGLATTNLMSAEAKTLGKYKFKSQFEVVSNKLKSYELQSCIASQDVQFLFSHFII